MLLLAPPRSSRKWKGAEALPRGGCEPWQGVRLSAARKWRPPVTKPAAAAAAVCPGPVRPQPPALAPRTTDGQKRIIRKTASAPVKGSGSGRQGGMTGNGAEDAAKVQANISAVFSNADKPEEQCPLKARNRCHLHRHWTVHE